jgi:hypothetical protein
MASPIAFAQKVVKKVRLKYYHFYSYISALHEYIFSPQGWTGGYHVRLRDLGKDTSHDKKHPSKIAIFIGYSASLSLSSRAYLEAIRSAEFDIIYISNCPIRPEFKAEFQKLCWKVFERHNLGRDFGGFKDGIIWADTNGYLESCQTLLMANDSMQFIPGMNAKSFVEHLTEFDKSAHIGLFSHVSYVHDIHYQSYFQVLKRDIFTSRHFTKYWKSYMPLSHRGHCIFKGEIALSQKVYRRFSNVKVLYSSSSLIEAFHLCSERTSLKAQELMRLMPSPARTLQRKQMNYILSKLLTKADEDQPMSEYDLFLISELIENNNPSHIAAFLFPVFLGCPLVKQDLCSAGSFSIAQASSLFKEMLTLSSINTALDKDDIMRRVDEFVAVLNQKGTPLSHMSKSKEAAIKGITGGFVYASVYDDN